MEMHAAVWRSATDKVANHKYSSQFAMASAPKMSMVVEIAGIMWYSKARNQIGLGHWAFAIHHGEFAEIESWRLATMVCKKSIFVFCP